MFYRERAIEVYRNHADLLAVLVQVVDSLARSFCCRAHEDDDALGVISSVIREQMIFAAGYLAYFFEIMFYYFGYLVIIFVASLAVCEECLGVLCRTACHGAFRCQRAVAEAFDVVHVNQRGDVFLLEHLDFVVFVRRAEAVEEVEERHTCLE